MKALKWGVMTFAMSSFLLAGCGEDLTQPPKGEMLTTNHKEKAVIGDYCWTVDGEKTCEEAEKTPQEMLKKADAIPVTMETAVSFKVDSEDKPSAAKISWVTEKGEKGEQKMDSTLFIAPKEKGIYYYTIEATWDGSGENKFEGTAEYNYKVKIQ